jgi:hypothetical protein
MNCLLLKYVALKGVHDISIGFLVGVDSICGSRDDCWQLTSPNFCSFGLSLFAKKADD